MKLTWRDWTMVIIPALVGVVLFLSLIVGCAPLATTYEKPCVSERQAAMDRFECYSDLVNEPVCMKEKGYDVR